MIAKDKHKTTDLGMKTNISDDIGLFLYKEGVA
jgi:hypothetical protein